MTQLPATHVEGWSFTQVWEAYRQLEKAAYAKWCIHLKDVSDMCMGYHWQITGTDSDNDRQIVWWWREGTERGPSIFPDRIERLDDVVLIGASSKYDGYVWRMFRADKEVK